MSPSTRCNQAAVRERLDAARERRLLAERAARDGHRRVELLDGRYVLKQFTYADGEMPARRPWQREHEALIHLRHPRLPESVGYLTETGSAGLTVSYLRGYVPGEPLTGFDPDSIAEAGRVLAGLHDRGVVTDDALTQNFLRAPDGALFFLDFGKARVFRPGSPLLPVWVALEHARFLRASLGGDEDLFRGFRRAYFGASRRGRVFATTVKLFTRAVRWQRRIRGRSGG